MSWEKAAALRFFEGMETDEGVFDSKTYSLYQTQPTDIVNDADDILFYDFTRMVSKIQNLNYSDIIITGILSEFNHNNFSLDGFNISDP